MKKIFDYIAKSKITLCLIVIYTFFIAFYNFYVFFIFPLGPPYLSSLYGIESHCDAGLMYCISYTFVIIRPFYEIISIIWFFVSLLVLYKKLVDFSIKIYTKAFLVIMFAAVSIGGVIAFLVIDDIDDLCFYYNKKEFNCMSGGIELSQGIYSFDLNNSEAVIGASNNAFIGKIIRKTPDSKIV